MSHLLKSFISWPRVGAAAASYFLMTNDVSSQELRISSMNLEEKMASSVFWRLPWLALVASLLLPGCQAEKKLPEKSVSLVANTIVRPQSSPAPKSDLQSTDAERVAPFVPDWVADAIFYQIFPERFRNGDPTNDPTRASLESEDVPQSWKVSSWTADWYEQDDWEKQIKDDFYEGGVFHRRYGGDLQGVIDKLDYLEKLGINAIYFNPVFYGRSLHKYDGASMHHIDPYFGPDPKGDFAIIADETSDPHSWQWTAADKLFLELIKQLHSRSMRVIIDGVFNHTGREFFAFVDLREKQEASPYKDWYIVQHYDDPKTPPSEFRYKSWWGFQSLPEFSDAPGGNDLHPGPKQYVFDITRRWMDPNGDGDPSDGVDGWRLDVANEVPAKFWKDWNTLVRELNPEAYTVGEFWGDARQHLIDGRFSGTMNYHGFAYLVKGFLIDGQLTAHDFGLRLQQRRQEYPVPMQFALQNLIDSHDTDRVASMIVNASEGNYRQADRFDYDVSEEVSPRSSPEYQITAPNPEQRRIQRLVALMQMTSLGTPMIYYGTEAGMWGADDPCDRMPMIWEDLSYADQTADPLGRPRTPDQVAFDHELFDYYRRVTQLRRESDVLRRGEMQLVDHDDEAKFFAFRRTLDGKSVLVVMNRGTSEYEWQWKTDNNVEFKQIFHVADPNETLPIQSEQHAVTLTIPALDGAVFSELSAEE